MHGKGSDFSTWKEFKGILPDKNVTFGRFYSYQFLNTPRSILFTLSKYKFASKLIGPKKNILEVGCSEGLGTLLLSEFANKVVAVDVDPEAINDANRVFKTNKIRFMHKNIFRARVGKFDAIVSFDVVEHVYKKNERLFFKSLCDNLTKFGICIIGTPNETSTRELLFLGKIK
ncbi:MAG: class I SAM-dependent methyltransferase [Candidatus Omnitrophica bacterium]|nr:class I SAM-dependent methyltransferase [Candidatus Omnitrophota bacterium]